jgi:hypothetical protein
MFAHVKSVERRIRWNLARNLSGLAQVPIKRLPLTWVLNFHFRWAQGRMPSANRFDDLLKYFVHHMTDATFEGFVFLW